MVPENKKDDVSQEASGSGGSFSHDAERRADEQMRTQERRKNVRTRQFKGGRVIFNEGYGCFNCLIRNISKGGAKLQLEGNAVIPALIDLEVPGDGLAYSCQVIWRTSRELGVRFLSPARQIGTKQDLKEIFTNPV